MPQQAPVGDYCTLHLELDGEFGGWDEEYAFLPGVDITQAKINGGIVATKRARLLAGSHSIIRAHVGRKSVFGDSNPPAAYTFAPVLVGSEMAIEETNDTGASLLYRFDSGDGHFRSFWLRAVRDSWITKNRYTLAAPTAYAVGGPYLTYSAPAAEVDLLGDFLATVRDLTCIYESDKLSPPSFTAFTFAEWQYRHVSSRKTGKRRGITKGKKAIMA